MGGSEQVWSLMCLFEHVVNVMSISCYVARVIENKKRPCKGCGSEHAWRLVCLFGHVAGVSHHPFVIVLDGIGVVPVLACSLFDLLAFNVVLDWLMIRPDPTASVSSSA